MTNSLQSRMMLEMKSPAVEVGMGVTEISYTDRRPYHIVRVISPKKIVVCPAKYRVVSGNRFDGSATYEITPGSPEEQGEGVLTLRSNGRWAEQGCSTKNSHWAVGFADYHYDPHF